MVLFAPRRGVMSKGLKAEKEREQYWEEKGYMVWRVPHAPYQKQDPFGVDIIAIKDKVLPPGPVIWEQVKSYYGKRYISNYPKEVKKLKWLALALPKGNIVQMAVKDTKTGEWKVEKIE